MIISASRRTDIPALYAEWFINRIHAGYCRAPNPFNPHQISTVSLRPEDVDAIVFWTRHPRPLLPYLAELDHLGYRYYFHYTVLGYPREIDPGSPPLEVALPTFRKLSRQIGAARVIWRYDPIIFSPLCDVNFHRHNFAHIAGALQGYTARCVISRCTGYHKTTRRLHALDARGVSITIPDASDIHFLELVAHLAHIAYDHGMELVSCAEEADLRLYGVHPGKCVDDALIHKIFGIRVTSQKDPGQRTACGCVVSKDIGMYDTCTMGCLYCYATSSVTRARLNRMRHDPHAPSLLPLSDI
ncbi:MAG: DUF1848 domain-containing protein [Anaerolineae bacterium]